MDEFAAYCIGAMPFGILFWALFVMVSDDVEVQKKRDARNLIAARVVIFGAIGAFLIFVVSKISVAVVEESKIITFASESEMRDAVQGVYVLCTDTLDADQIVISGDKMIKRRSHRIDDPMNVS